MNAHQRRVAIRRNRAMVGRRFVVRSRGQWLDGVGLVVPLARRWRANLHRVRVVITSESGVRFERLVPISWLGREVRTC